MLNDDVDDKFADFDELAEISVIDIKFEHIAHDEDDDDIVVTDVKIQQHVDEEIDELVYVECEVDEVDEVVCQKHVCDVE